MTILIKAKEVTEGYFVYLPKENRFFLVDFIVHDKNRVELISEIDITENGIKEDIKKFHEDDLVCVLYNYKIEPNELLQDIEDFYTPKGISDDISESDAEKRILEGKKRITEIKERMKMIEE